MDMDPEADGSGPRKKTLRHIKFGSRSDFLSGLSGQAFFYRRGHRERPQRPRRTAEASWNEMSQNPASEPTGWTSVRPSESNPLKLLLRLHGLNIVHQIRNSLLNLGFVALVDAGEQRSPNRHVLAPVGRRGGLPADHGSNVGCGIFPRAFLCKSRQISRISLHGGGRRAVAFAIESMTHGTITLVHLLARCGRGFGDRNMLYGRSAWSRGRLPQGED